MQSVPEEVKANSCLGFCYYSVVQRLPLILEQIIKEGTVTREQVQPLIDEINNNEFLKPIKTGPEIDDFNSKINGLNWLNSPWYFVETYYYRRLYDLIGYIDNHQDPFRVGKTKQWNESIASFEQISKILSEVNKEKIFDEQQRNILLSLLYMCLWGNKADLCISPTGVKSSDLLFQLSKDHEMILIDDSQSTISYLTSLKEARIDLIIDNVGIDVFSDLAVADFLIHFCFVSRVNIHIKALPIFVSDVTLEDMNYMISFLKNHQETHIIGERWENYIKSGVWTVKPHLFWDNSAPLWDAPSDIKSILTDSKFIILKGDANNRRIHGDRRWPFTTPTNDIVSKSFPSTPILLVRTLKSETASGFSQALIDQLNKQEEEEKVTTSWKGPVWLSAGKYGILQFIHNQI